MKIMYVNCDVNQLPVAFIFTSLSAVHINDFQIFTVSTYRIDHRLWCLNTEIKVTITFQSILNGSFHLHRNWIFNWPGKKGHVRAFSPQGKQRSNDYACVNVGWRIDPCCLTGIIRNHASQRIKLFWSYSSFNFLYFCFFSLMYRNTSFFLHVMYNRSCFLCFPWNFWAGNRRAAGENTYHLRMPYVSPLWFCHQGRTTLYFSILFSKRGTKLPFLFLRES